MEKVVERPVIPADPRSAAMMLQQVLQQYGFAINQLVAPVELIAPTYLNGWVDYTGSGGVFEVPTYCKDAFGFVRLFGLADGSASSATTIFTLPERFRPRARHLYTTQSAIGGLQRIDVLANGDVVFTSGGAPAWVSLTGICFLADL